MIITSMCSAMPTAVITESSEKTMSSTRSARSRATKVAFAARRVLVLVAFQLVVDLVRALPEQEQAAAEQDQVAPGDRLAEDREQRLGQRA